jgi:hypothetical protein
MKTYWYFMHGDSVLSNHIDKVDIKFSSVESIVATTLPSLTYMWFLSNIQKKNLSNTYNNMSCKPIPLYKFFKTSILSALFMYAMKGKFNLNTMVILFANQIIYNLSYLDQFYICLNIDYNLLKYFISQLTFTSMKKRIQNPI